MRKCCLSGRSFWCAVCVCNLHFLTRLLSLSGVGSTTCSLYTWQHWMPTQTAAGNCCHRVSKSPSVPGTPAVFVSAACSPFPCFVVNYSNEGAAVLGCVGYAEHARLSQSHAGTSCVVHAQSSFLPAGSESLDSGEGGNLEPLSKL